MLSGWRLPWPSVSPTKASEEERQKVYDLEIDEIKDSPGLSVDIGFIAALDAAIAPRRPPRELAGFRETGVPSPLLKGLVGRL